MGFFTNVRGIWDPEARITATIDSQRKTFQNARSNYPGRDVNAWLALTLMARRGAWTSDWDVETYHLATVKWSLLSETDRIKGLAYFILQKEDPNSYPLVTAENERILSILGQSSPEDASSRWLQQNPWTASNFPRCTVVIKEMIEGGYK
jgi:hypothetical protein